MSVFVQPHAIQRFQERVCACSDAEARDSILSHSRAIEAAAAFGATFIRLGDGARLVIDGSHPIPSVVTVYGRHMLPRHFRTGDGAL